MACNGRVPTEPLGPGATVTPTPPPLSDLTGTWEGTYGDLDPGCEDTAAVAHLTQKGPDITGTVVAYDGPCGFSGAIQLQRSGSQLQGTWTPPPGGAGGALIGRLDGSTLTLSFSGIRVSGRYVGATAKLQRRIS